MVRQARTYFLGAISGFTLIGIAIAAFVVLVSAQVFRDWPIASLGSHGDKPAVSDADRVSGPSDSGAAATPRLKAPANAAAGAARGAVDTGAAGAKPHGNRDAAQQPNVSPSDVPVSTAPGDKAAPVETGSGDNSGGNPSHQPSDSGSSPGDPPSAAPTSSSPGNPTGTSGSGGKGTETPKLPVQTPVQPTAPSTSAAATGTVNGAVNGVDETVTGGALKEAGVTGATEGVVNGAAGPESVVGKTVDETVGAVGGLLGGKK